MTSSSNSLHWRFRGTIRGREEALGSGNQEEKVGLRGTLKKKNLDAAENGPLEASKCK